MLLVTTISTSDASAIVGMFMLPISSLFSSVRGMTAGDSFRGCWIPLMLQPWQPCAADVMVALGSMVGKLLGAAGALDNEDTGRGASWFMLMLGDPEAIAVAL